MKRLVIALAIIAIVVLWGGAIGLLIQENPHHTSAKTAAESPLKNPQVHSIVKGCAQGDNNGPICGHIPTPPPCPTNLPADLHCVSEYSPYWYITKSGDTLTAISARFRPFVQEPAAELCVSRRGAEQELTIPVTRPLPAGLEVAFC